jgi:hypothetical protein
MSKIYKVMTQLVDAWIEARRMQAEAAVRNRLG